MPPPQITTLGLQALAPLRSLVRLDVSSCLLMHPYRHGGDAGCTACLAYMTSLRHLATHRQGGGDEGSYLAASVLGGLRRLTGLTALSVGTAVAARSLQDQWSLDCAAALLGMQVAGVDAGAQAAGGAAAGEAGGRASAALAINRAGVDERWLPARYSAGRGAYEASIASLARRLPGLVRLTVLCPIMLAPRGDGAAAALSLEHLQVIIGPPGYE